MLYNISQITTIIGARRIGSATMAVSWIITDSRSLCFPEESIFFALNTIAATYIETLYERGVRQFVVCEADEKSVTMHRDANYLVTPCALTALQRLAERHRERFSCPVIGITGSNGKTIVKEWLYRMLMADRNITRSPRSYNSQIGVPLSVWGMDEDTTLGIFEAGISMPGEMARLQGIIQPTIGVFTNLGPAHQENFDGPQQKAVEKLGLFKDTETLVVNTDDLLVRRSLAMSEFRGRIVTWSRTSREAEVYIEDRKDGSLPTCTIKGSSFVMPFSDEASVSNAATCAAVCLQLGLSPDTIAQRMALLEPVAMRMEVKQGSHGVTIINDYANNDYESLDIALDFMQRLPEAEGREHLLVLGDMQQTGLTQQQLRDKVDSLLKGRSVTPYYIGRGWCQVYPDTAWQTVEAFLADDRSRLKDCVVLLKGPSDAGFSRITKSLERNVHETILNVDLQAVTANFNHYRRMLRPGVQTICMVKADAYGAGAVMVSKQLQLSGADYLAVAVADEGVELRKAGITKPIIVMNPEMHALRTLFAYNLQPEVYSFRLFDALVREARSEGVTDFPIHIKLDTGMHRLGFDVDKDMTELVRSMRKQKALLPISVFSHFVGADDDAFDDFSEIQYNIFMKGADALQAAFPHHILRHICNSAAIEHFPQRQLDMVRLGLGLYGINPRGNALIHPVSQLTTTILQIHELDEGETVGYGRHTTLERKSRIAAIPIGYADGLNRRLGNRKGYCIVNGRRADYVGNICMDVAMIDVTDIRCKEGDRAVIFGSDRIPVTALSEALGTIPYEILTSVSNRVQRIYFRE